MLVLSRKKNQKIIISTPLGIIECVVVQISGGKVRLGFNAPREIPVHREEVFKTIVQAEAANK